LYTVILAGSDETGNLKNKQYRLMVSVIEKVNIACHYTPHAKGFDVEHISEHRNNRDALSLKKEFVL